MLDDLAIQTQTIKQQHENEMARVGEAHVVSVQEQKPSYRGFFV